MNPSAWAGWLTVAANEASIGSAIFVIEKVEILSLMGPNKVAIKVFGVAKDLAVPERENCAISGLSLTDATEMRRVLSESSARLICFGLKGRDATVETQNYRIELVGSRE